jgi:hypothetical protein
MQDPPLRRVLLFLGSGVAASRKWSRARSGFRAQRERRPTCRWLQVRSALIRKIVISTQPSELVPPPLAVRKHVSADPQVYAFPAMVEQLHDRLMFL